MAKTEPVSQAIRAMGTNSLPFLLAHIKRPPSPLRVKLFALLGKQRLVKLPFYGEEAYQWPSMLALHALGSQALPLLPELLPVAQDPRSCWGGVMSLLAIGTNSIPTLERACQSTDNIARTYAVLGIAILRTMRPPAIECVWLKAQLNGKPLLHLSPGGTGDDAGEIVKLLEHSDPAVRRASANYLALCHWGLHADVIRSAIPRLTKALNDEDQRVRKAAGDALKSIDPQAAAKAGIKVA